MENMHALSQILLFPILGALIIALTPKEKTDSIRQIAVGAMVYSFIITLLVYFQYDVNAGGMQFIERIPWVTDLGVSYSLGVDGLSLPMLMLTEIIGITSVFSSWYQEKRVKEFFVLLLILIAGVTGTFIACDLFIFLLCYELVVIPIYIMVLIWGSTKRVPKEYAGIKLTIFLLMGSAFMLVGIVAIYLTAYPEGLRTFDLEKLVLSSRLGYLSSDFQIFAFFLLLLGFGSLLSMFPFHSWSPDGYAGAPTAVSMIHAGVLKKIGGYALIRLGLMVLPLGAKFWAPLIALLAMINVLYAAYIALVQKDLKYIIGYSSVSHMGYVLLGFAALNPVSLSGAVGNMVAHGIMASLFFSQIGYVYERTHLRSIPELRGLAHQMPNVSLGFMLAGFASVGLPGLIEFVPEYTIFVGSFRVYPVLSVFAISGVVFTALYILRMLAKAIFGPKSSKFDKYHDARGFETAPLVFLGFFLVILGLFPELLMGVIRSGITPMAPLLENIADAPTIVDAIIRHVGIGGGLW